jgi:DNA-3-methyladenine glycosylase
MSGATLTSASLARLSPLQRSFYSRDPRTVARELLGKLLIRDLRAGASLPAAPAHAPSPAQRFLAGRIVEAEAYLGPLDPAAHTYRGLTARNAVLFGPPGHAYIYFIYGNHYCTNVSCQPIGDPGGVLLRALEPVCGLAQMAFLRSAGLAAHPERGAEPFTPSRLRSLTSGPGRLSQALGITRTAHNGCDLCSRAGGLYFAADPAWEAAHVRDAEVSATPRINTPRAPHDEYRYILTANPFVSG